MRLELQPEASSASSRAGRWVLERGRRTVGRSPECDWQLPEDERSVSKLHCLIERQGDRFILFDRSSNGSKVDGMWLRDGASAPLTDEGVVKLGNLSFRVLILGQKAVQQEDPDGKLTLSSESLTISSILSDIVPAGQMASGVMGPRETDEPFAFVQPQKSNASSSRNVTIGWSGPPEPEKQGKLLPDNWWEETEADNQFGHALEHTAAPRVSVSLSRAGSPNGSPQMESDPQTIEPETDRLPARNSALPSGFEARLKRLEQAMEQTLATLEMPVALPFDSNPFLNPAGDPLTDRLSVLIAQQLRMNEALERMFKESGRLFDPRLLEARTDGQSKLPFLALRDAGYWRHYRRQFEKDGRALSAADLLRKTYLTEEAEELESPNSASEEGKRPDEV